MAEQCEARNLLVRALWRHFRQRRVQRSLEYNENSTLSGISGAGTREDPIVVEDSDPESTPGDGEREQDAEYVLLLERVLKYIRANTRRNPEDILLLVSTILRKLESTSQKIGYLQGMCNYLMWGETDEETSDTDADEDED